MKYQGMTRRRILVSAANATALFVATTPALAQNAESCEQHGGKMFASTCNIGTRPAPFNVVYTGRFQRPDFGPLFTITNTSSRILRVEHFLAFLYDKDGKQIPFQLGGGGTNWFAGSGPFVLDLKPGESGEHPLYSRKRSLPPEMASFQGEVNDWTIPNNMAGFARFRREITLAQLAARPSGGWRE